MSYLVAVTGKGGTGKTTIAALVVNRLIARGRGPVLAVDADPNTCLDRALGVQVTKSVGTVREEARQIASQGSETGIAKQQLLELKIAESLVEADQFDLIAMGRSEGPGCYCYANNVLKAVLGALSSQYPIAVLDNEAGLENLSRRIVQKVELLIMVADPSRQGLETVRRLHRLAQEMGIQYARSVLVVNRLRSDSLSAAAMELQSEVGAEIALGFPDDEVIAKYGERGQSLNSLPDANPVVTCVDSLLDQVGLTGPTRQMDGLEQHARPA